MIHVLNKSFFLYTQPSHLGDVTESTGIGRAWMAFRRLRLRKNVTVKYN